MSLWSLSGPKTTENSTIRAVLITCHTLYDQCCQATKLWLCWLLNLLFLLSHVSCKAMAICISAVLFSSCNACLVWQICHRVRDVFSIHQALTIYVETLKFKGHWQLCMRGSHLLRRLTNCCWKADLGSNCADIHASFLQEYLQAVQVLMPNWYWQHSDLQRAAQVLQCTSTSISWQVWVYIPVDRLYVCTYRFISLTWLAWSITAIPTCSHTRWFWYGLRAWESSMLLMLGVCEPFCLIVSWDCCMMSIVNSLAISLAVSRAQSLSYAS